MLESDYSEAIEQLFETLPCTIRLPSTWDDFWQVEGMMPSAPNERRKGARKRYRAKAVLEILETLPGVERPRRIAPVYVSDISRDGLRLIHSDQLYPRERIRVWLPDQRVTLMVVRCNKVGPRCYCVGATKDSG